MPMLLLLVFTVALSIGFGVVVLVLRRAKNKLKPGERPLAHAPGCPFEHSSFVRRPGCWLAIKSRSVSAVQAAFGLHNAKRCSCLQGLSGEEKLFIAPPVRGWIVVTGSGLPEPSDDVDSCFRFVLDLSRRLGHVQFFSVSRVLQHHAWVQADKGRVVRAYAWAGRTLWQQGRRTPAERELDLKCFDYTEAATRDGFGSSDSIALNVDKLPLLAARWSLDPARIDERFLEHATGVAGDPSLRF
jgi:hypothetical protein